VFVPVTLDADAIAEASRALDHAEIVQLLRSVGGSSTFVPDGADEQFDLVESPLRDYLLHFGRPGNRPLSMDAVARTGYLGSPLTIRMLVEMVLTVVGEPLQRHWRPTTALSDEVLRAVRLNGMWSTLVVSEEFDPFDPRRPRIEDGTWWPPARPQPSVRPPADGVPPSVLAMLDALGDRDGMPISPTDRVDQGGDASRGALSWVVPNRRSLVTAYTAGRELFPGPSALYLFSWFGHMLVSIASAGAMIGTLTLEANYSRNNEVVELARESYLLTLEMEEMYDVDLAWREYEQFYRQVRERVGLQGVFERARSRLDQLSQQAEVVTRARTERTLKHLQWVAVALTLGVVAVGVAQTFAVPKHNGWAWGALVIGACVVVIASVIALTMYLSDRRERRDDP